MARRFVFPISPQTSGEESRPRRSRKRRCIAISLGICLLAAILSYSFWLPFLVEAAAPALARRFAGYELELGAVERFDLGGVRLRGLRVREIGATPTLLELRIDFLDAEYGAGLAAGDLAALSSVRGKGIRVHVDADVEATEETTLELRALLPSRLPTIELSEVEVLIQSGGEEIAITEIACAVDDHGQLRMDARHAGRAIQLRSTWNETSAQALELSVDGRKLLSDSELQLARVLQGELRAELHLLVGSSSNRVSTELAGGAFKWDANFAGIDLAQLEAQLPVALDADMLGVVDLRTRGQLDLAQPWLGAATLAFELNSCRAYGWPMEAAQGELRLEAGVLEIRRLDAHVSAQNHVNILRAELPLENITAANWLERAQGALQLEVRDMATLLAPAGLLDEAASELVEHRIALSADVAGGRMTVSEGVVESTAGRIQLDKGELWLDPQTGDALTLDISGDADLSSLEAIGALFGRAGWSGQCRGRLFVHGTWPELRGGLELAGSDITIEGYALGLLELELGSVGTSGSVQVKKLHSESAVGHLDLRMSAQLLADPIELEFEEVRLARDGRGLTLQEVARATLGANGGSIGPLRLAGEAGEISLSSTWTDAGLVFDAEVSELHPEVFIDAKEVELPHFVNATFGVHGNYSAHQLTFNSSGEMLQLVLPQLAAPLDVLWNATYADNRLTLSKFDALGGERTNASFSGSLPIQLVPAVNLGSGALQLAGEAQLPVELLLLDHQGDLYVTTQLSGDWQALAGSIDVRADGLRFPPEVHPAELEDGELRGRLVLEQGLRWEELSLTLGDLLDVRVTGRLESSLDLNRWIEDAPAAANESRIDNQVTLGQLDVARLSSVLSAYSESAEALRAGLVTGSLRVHGPMLEPELDGELNLTEGRMRLGGGLPSVNDLVAKIEFAHPEVRVERVTGTLGSSPFVLSGTAQLATEKPELELTLSGQDLLFFRSPSGKVRANSNLTIRGAVDALEVAGRVELTDGYFSPDTQFLSLRQSRRSSGVRGFQLFSLREAPLSRMLFDVQLDAREPFEIRNSVLRGSVRPKLHLGGTGLVPVLTGEVYVDPSRLKLPATTMQITGGTVRFSRENPFVPTVDVTGTARTLGYDVLANIGGDYDQPEVQFSSTPPLSQEDLFLLMVTGKLPTDPDQTNALSAANTVALYLARDSLSRWFSDDGPIDEDAILERLDFAIGQDVSKNGTETVDVAYRLTSKADLPPEVRNLRHLYLTAERDKYEDYNYGLRLVFRFRR